VALALCAPFLVHAATGANADLGIAFFFVAGFLFVGRAVDGPESDRGLALLLAGICAGMLAASKLNGFVGSALLAAWYLVAARDAWRLRARRWLVCFVLPTLFFWLPWPAKSAWYTGNPVYPFQYGRFGGPDWSESLSAQLLAWQWSIGRGHGFVDLLLLPFRVSLFGGPGYQNFTGSIGFIWLAVFPFALIAGWKDRFVRAAVGLAAVYFLTWAYTSQQARMLLPALPLLAMAGAIACEDRLARLPASVMRLATAAALLVILAVYAGLWGTAARALRFRLAQHAAPAEAELDSAERFLRRYVPPDARLLLLNTNAAFFIEQEVLADSFFEASQIADWLRGAASEAEVRRRLDERGVTHVLARARDWGIEYPQGLGELLEDPREARTLFRDRDFWVLELRPRG
jgi:4-amino-4-deoxy-L-arabinose transferase-like glycosyltransferase